LFDLAVKVVTNLFIELLFHQLASEQGP
jgi:hypothetical protein